MPLASITHTESSHSVQKFRHSGSSAQAPHHAGTGCTGVQADIQCAVRGVGAAADNGGVLVLLDSAELAMVHMPSGSGGTGEAPTFRSSRTPPAAAPFPLPRALPRGVRGVASHDRMRPGPHTASAPPTPCSRGEREGGIAVFRRSKSLL